MRSLILIYIYIGSIILCGSCAAWQDSDPEKQIGIISNDKSFFSNTNITKYQNQEWDENGIPLIKYNDTEYHNPVNLCQVAIHYFEHYRIYNDPRSKKIFMRLANWLSKNFIYNQNRDFGGWYYPIAIDKYSCDPPWLSAMSQGLALPVLYQAYKMTGDESYLQTGSKAINSFLIKVEDGGILRYLDGSLWYEEYAGSKESYVLNGYIFAISGLEYWSEHVNGYNSKKAALLFRKGIIRRWGCS